MTKKKKVFFDLIAYVDKKKRKVGYAYGTEKGNICIKADKMIDAATLGRLLKNDGLYVMERTHNRKNEAA